MWGSGTWDIWGVWILWSKTSDSVKMNQEIRVWLMWCHGNCYTWHFFLCIHIGLLGPYMDPLGIVIVQNPPNDYYKSQGSPQSCTCWILPGSRCKETILFQSSIFRCYVSFRKGRGSWSNKKCDIILMKSCSQWGVFDGLFQLVHIPSQPRKFEYNEQEHIWNQERNAFNGHISFFYTDSL